MDRQIPKQDIDKNFQGWDKIHRFRRDIVISEKIDGTNAQIYFPKDDSGMLVGSRKRYITPDKDNFGFAAWAYENEEILKRVLGYGRHYGEWYGQGIQREYGLDHKRFALFNTARWEHLNDPTVRANLGVPDNMGVVPVIYHGPWTANRDDSPVDAVQMALETLASTGSFAVHGFMNPEGVVIFHAQSRMLFKATIKNDDKPKSLVTE